MSKAKRVVFAFCAVMLSGPVTSVQANVGSYAVDKETQSVTHRLEKRDFQALTQQALNALVAHGVYELKKRGHDAEATRYEKEWDRSFSRYFTGVGILDLGDHAPLSLWLVDFYDGLEKVLGKWLCHEEHFDDIRILNYAVPVVLHPCGGDDGDSWDQAEYAKHFVPFSGVVTYWAGKTACEMATSGILNFMCGPAAEVARMIMERWIAPPISDAAYTQARNIQCPAD